MRVYLLSISLVRALIPRGGTCLLAGLAWNASVASTFAAEKQSERSTRLGFSFDQKAHDARVAAKERERKGAGFANEPLDPDVVRLPNYDVREQPIELEDDETLTAKGRLEVAKKRHLTPMYQKTFGPLSAVLGLLNNPLGGWNPNGPEAMALYEDAAQKRRNARMSELQDLAELAELAKTTKANAIKGKSDAAKKR